MDTHAIILRLAGHDDAEDLRAHFSALSPASRNHRFLGGVAEVTPAEIRRLIGGPGSTLFCVIATQPSQHGRAIVGEAVCAVARRADIALSVSDAVQGCGIGRALLAAVETLLARSGSDEICGTMLSGNERIRRLVRAHGYAIERVAGDWTQQIFRKKIPPCETIAVRPGREPMSWLQGHAGACRQATIA